MIDTAGLASVDLTNTVFASPGNRDALMAKYTGEIPHAPAGTDETASCSG